MNLNGHGFQGVVLRLPASLRTRAADLANQECLSLNLFIASAVAEKIHRLEQERRPALRVDSPVGLPSLHHEDVLLCQ